MTARRRIVTLHRWLGLAAAAFWLLQAATGAVIVFHWEVRDAALSSIHRPTDLIALKRRLDMLVPPGSTAAIGSIWTTAGLPDRYDIYFTDKTGIDRSARIAGDGTVLRGPDVPTGGLLDTAVGLHHDLLAGATGDWIVGVSRLLLVTNLIAGLIAAWLKAGVWRIALGPIGKGNRVARLHSWHRAAGLWAVLPALLIATTGTLLQFPTALSTATGAQTPMLPSLPRTDERVGFAAAAGAALKALPGSTLTSVTFPDAGDGTYRFRLKAADEIRRAYGASVVLIDASNGSLRGSFPITKASLATRFVDTIIPVHTGQVAGPLGRILTLIVGLWLTLMIVTGLLLWAWRRTKRARV